MMVGIIIVGGIYLSGASSSQYNLDTMLVTSFADSSSSSSSCVPVSSKVFSERLLIDFQAVREMSKDRLSQLKQYTVQRYEKFVMAPPGREHYTLLEYIVSTFGPRETEPCADSEHRRHVADIGTRYIASALALGASHGVVVKTFDLPNSRERQEAFRGRTEQEWQQQVLAAGVHITFVNQNLVDVSDDEFMAYTGTWLISLDTHHLPYTRPFEREFFARLAKSGYQGLLFLDDIHLNPEMKKWWAELQENASSMNYRCFDLTAIGHSTGSGLVDFSGKVEISQ